MTKGWIIAVEARLQRALAQEMLSSSERLGSLARDRLRVGNGDQFDVAVADANSQALRDTVRVLDLSYTNALRALEMLVGRYPAAAVGVGRRAAGMARRFAGGDSVRACSSAAPDVVAAERRVAAAFYSNVQEAKAARLPRISLVASATSVNSELFVLQERDNPVLSAGIGIVQPIFLGGTTAGAGRAAHGGAESAAIADYGNRDCAPSTKSKARWPRGAAAGDRERILAAGRGG